MSFESILNEIVEGCGGGLGAALMGSDGVPIAEVVADTPAAREYLIEEIGIAGAEFSRILSEIAKASDALGGGASLGLKITADGPSISAIRATSRRTAS